MTNGGGGRGLSLLALLRAAHASTAQLPSSSAAACRRHTSALARLSSHSYHHRHLTAAMPPVATVASASSSAAASDVAFLFPGQGAQKLGMTKSELALPAVAELYATAERVLGYDLKKIVTEGPEDELNSTVHCQPAMLVAGLAGLEKLRAERPEVLEQCQAAAGLSLGEYTALVFAGAMSVEDALALVKIRAEAMQQASDASTGVMLSVVGIDDARLEEACRTASSSTGGEARIANFLAPGIRAVSGDKAAVTAVHDAIAADAVKVQFLAVSGAFHSSLMAPATEALAAALAETKISMPRIKVYANTTGKPYTSMEEIRTELQKQVSAPVLWQDSLEAMLADGHTRLFEIGPQRQIKSMLRKLNPAAFKQCTNVTV